MTACRVSSIFFPLRATLPPRHRMHHHQLAHIPRPYTAHHAKVALKCIPNDLALQFYRDSSCPSQGWLDTILPVLRRENETFTFVNVGCNKGFAVASMAHRFGKPLNSSEWFLALIDYERKRSGRAPRGSHLGEMCGSCCACLEVPSMVMPPVGHEKAPLAVHAIEFAPANARWLKHAFAAFQLPAKLHHAGASNTSGMVMVSAKEGPLGYEAEVLDEDKAIRPNETNTVPLPLIALDDLAVTQSLSHMEFVSIDTEGHDSLVLEGMRGLLREKRVGLFEFEYSAAGKWDPKEPDSRRLRDTLSWVQSVGYDCYWESFTGCLAFASPPCWNDAYGSGSWSNLVCTQRHSRAGAALAAYASDCAYRLNSTQTLKNTSITVRVDARSRQILGSTLHPAVGRRCGVWGQHGRGYKVHVQWHDRGYVKDALHDV